MATGFISYTHVDSHFKDQLIRHLAPIRREGLIEVWHDGMLKPGEHLDPTVQAALAQSDLVLLLISSDFFHSEYCYEQEMVRAFARQREGLARVVPIILRPCQWMAVPIGEGQRLSDFVALPKDGLPVTSWSDADAAYNDVAGAIREMLRATPAAQAAKPVPEREAPSPAEGSRSSPASGVAPMLALNAKPTDLDRDRFLRMGFSATADLFERNLRELKASDARIETDLERIDSRTFVASVYLDGNRVGMISIWHGGDMWQNALCIAYGSAVSARNTMNDWLAIETGQHGLAFGAGNVGARSRAKGPLDADQAATYCWDSFLDHLRSRIK
ncbi:MAG: toll/interleukin-1 receptor domain-containing protein [Sphingomonadales bacterium]|nr:toll/interleukin-1 receptor domain-containing protein [Sphingomonadales bacterium]MDE2171550.1 toll/interleukin-1 receptor domain-containing protein [Sphingomonadales bacterium]